MQVKINAGPYIGRAGGLVYMQVHNNSLHCTTQLFIAILAAVATEPIYSADWPE
jgi:hypothetical protein